MAPPLTGDPLRGNTQNAYFSQDNRGKRSLAIALATAKATPADVGQSTTDPVPEVPELGQHTEEVLLELGFDWDRITGLKEAGVIP